MSLSSDLVQDNFYNIVPNYIMCIWCSSAEGSGEVHVFVTAHYSEARELPKSDHAG